MALILLIEDEKLLRWSLKKRLEKEGHTVHTAENLEEAEVHVSQHFPDMVLLDLSLPDGHGLDFYEKHHDTLDESVVLVMTAVGEVEDAVRAMFCSCKVPRNILVRNRAIAITAAGMVAAIV